MAIKKKTDPKYVGFVTEPYSPPYANPRPDVFVPLMRVDEPYSPSYPIPRKMKTSPKYVGRVDEPYTPSHTLRLFQNRTTYQKTRRKRLV